MTDRELERALLRFCKEKNLVLVPMAEANEANSLSRSLPSPAPLPPPSALVGSIASVRQALTLCAHDSLSRNADLHQAGVKSLLACAVSCASACGMDLNGLLGRAADQMSGFDGSMGDVGDGVDDGLAALLQPLSFVASACSENLSSDQPMPVATVSRVSAALQSALAVMMRDVSLDNAGREERPAVPSLEQRIEAFEHAHRDMQVSLATNSATMPRVNPYSMPVPRRAVISEHHRQERMRELAGVGRITEQRPNVNLTETQHAQRRLAHLASMRETRSTSAPQLLLESYSPSVQLLTEASGKKFVRATLQSTELNRNHRQYPLPVLEKSVRTAREKIASGTLYAQADHPQGPDGTPTISQSAAIWRAVELTPDGRIEGTAELLNTQAGRNLRACLEAGATVGVSARGYGHLLPDGQTVSEDYEISSWDFVIGPSDSAARTMEVS